jgi:hypothetical protein
MTEIRKQPALLRCFNELILQVSFFNYIYGIAMSYLSNTSADKHQQPQQLLR